MYYKRTQRPGHSLHHHVITIIYQQTTHLKGTSNVPPAPLRPRVEWYGANQRRSSPPTVVRASPLVDQIVGHLPVQPGRPCQDGRESVHGPPTVDAPTEFLEFRFSDALEGSSVVLNQLTSKPSLAVALKQFSRHVENEL